MVSEPGSSGGDVSSHEGREGNGFMQPQYGGANHRYGGPARLVLMEVV